MVALVLCGVIFLAAACSSASTRSTGSAASSSNTRSTNHATSTSVAVSGAYCSDLKTGLLETASQRPTTPAQLKALAAKLNAGLASATRDAPASLRPSTQALANMYVQLTAEAAAHGYATNYVPPDSSKLQPIVSRFMAAFGPWAKTNCPEVLAGLSEQAPPTTPVTTTPGG